MSVNDLPVGRSVDETLRLEANNNLFSKITGRNCPAWNRSCSLLMSFHMGGGGGVCRRSPLTRTSFASAYDATVVPASPLPLNNLLAATSFHPPPPSLLFPNRLSFSWMVCSFLDLLPFLGLDGVLNISHFSFSVVKGVGCLNTE
jgi:hypothetical protein